MKDFCPNCTHYPICEVRKAMEIWLHDKFRWASGKEPIELTNDWFGLLAGRCEHFEIQTPKEEKNE